MADIFEYTDFRKFLRDFQDEMRNRDGKFSHRYFAMKAGFSSTGLLSNIMQGRRNLTSPLIHKFARALKLNKKEAEYFENLVHFNQAKTVEDKNVYFDRMLRISPLKADVVSKERYEFYSEWWYSAIRELLYYFPFKGDYQALARMLDPPLRPEQAKKAIATLEKLNMIERKPDGTYKQTSAVLTTGKDHEHTLHLANFKRTTMELALQSLDRQPREHRDISTLTLTFSNESFGKARLELEAVQNRLLKMANDDNAVDCVYQINMQMFPLTRKGTGQ
jgi:uncharacterized protein (TIGR02147 family)